jgi:hypothetical protein
MKIKLDENLPSGLKPILDAFGHEVDTVPDEGLAGTSDSDVWRAAQGEGRFLITQDLDFSDIRKFAPGTHAGVLILRLRAPGAGALTRRVRDLFEIESVEDWRGGFVVATDRKLRLHLVSDT